MQLGQKNTKSANLGCTGGKTTPHCVGLGRNKTKMVDVYIFRVSENLVWLFTFCFYIQNN
jgi:hypothetical protein